MPKQASQSSTAPRGTEPPGHAAAVARTPLRVECGATASFTNGASHGLEHAAAQRNRRRGRDGARRTFWPRKSRDPAVDSLGAGRRAARRRCARAGAPGGTARPRAVRRAAPRRPVGSSLDKKARKARGAAREFGFRPRGRRVPPPRPGKRPLRRLLEYDAAYARASRPAAATARTPPAAGATPRRYHPRRRHVVSIVLLQGARAGAAPGLDRGRAADHRGGGAQGRVVSGGGPRASIADVARVLESGDADAHLDACGAMGRARRCSARSEGAAGVLRPAAHRRLLRWVDPVEGVTAARLRDEARRTWHSSARRDCGGPPFGDVAPAPGPAPRACFAMLR